MHKSLGKAIQCGHCHTTDKWKPSTFDHTKYFRFDGNHPSNCVDCHDVNKTFNTYSCYNCNTHNPAKIEKKHIKEGIRNSSNCVECHRSGDEKEAEGRRVKKLGRDRDDN
jgi:mono/diheme cytochrome c family protein